ncbi:MAG: conserved membrane protein of unknown function [Promethearchaeota archaeon]|nr:MAG: conserved membrane protein of unknown function [Candidatus Lokiarchaeota archaeon]
MNNNKRKLLLQIANLLTPIPIFVVTSLISLLVPNFGQPFDSEGYESLIDPSGFAFAIWFPIFIFLGIFYFYQARDLFKSDEDKIEMSFIHQISIFFILSTIMPALWYLFWGFQVVWLSTLFMILYLVVLLMGYLRLEINLVERSRIEKIAIVVPWSMHTAWITAATIISVKTFFISISFNNPPFLFPENVWAILILLVALAIYTAVVITRKDYIFGAVGIWVLFAILAERLTAPTLVLEIVIVCIIGIGILTLALIYMIYRT